MKNIIYSKKKGFSIAETLLASFVLIVGAISLVHLMSANISNTADNRNMIVASQLAQEGVELVRNARDNNAGQRYLDKKKNISPLRSIFKGFSSCGGGIEYSSYYSSIAGLVCNLNLNLMLNGDNMYVSSADASSNLKRRIVLNSSGGTPIEYYDVVSLVTWGNTPVPNNISSCKISNKCVYVKARLTRWIEIN